jgi:hypothetical protein
VKKMDFEKKTWIHEKRVSKMDLKTEKKEERKLSKHLE